MAWCGLGEAEKRLGRKREGQGRKERSELKALKVEMLGMRLYLRALGGAFTLTSAKPDHG